MTYHRDLMQWHTQRSKAFIMIYLRLWQFTCVSLKVFSLTINCLIVSLYKGRTWTATDDHWPRSRCNKRQIYSNLSFSLQNKAVEMFWLPALNMISLAARFSWCSWRFGSEWAVWSWFVHIPCPRGLSKRLEVSSRCSCLLSQSGCSFGGRFYSLEDTWHPDLGEPFGVMHCVMCHCEPVTRQTHSAFHNISTLRVVLYVCMCCRQKNSMYFVFV